MNQEPSEKAGPKPRARRRVKRELVRGEPVVQRVLAATMEELARVGYRALRVEDVAARAEVNKTTVYRRWPEKSALVRDALGCMADARFSVPDTGSLRGDLLALGSTMVGLLGSPQGQSVVRMLVAEGTDAEVADLKRSLREGREAVPLAVFAAAVARGELRPGADPHLVFRVFMGAVQHQMFFMNEAVTPAHLERLVDLILLGALRAAPAKTAPAMKAPAMKAPAKKAPAKKR